MNGTTQATDKPKTLEVFFDNAVSWTRVTCQVARHVDGVPIHAETATGVITGTRLEHIVSDQPDPFGTEGRLYIERDAIKISLTEAERFVRQLANITTTLNLATNSSGSPATFGVQCTRFARATGCTKFWIWRPNEPVVQTDDPYAAAAVIDSEIAAQKQFMRGYATRKAGETE